MKMNNEQLAYYLAHQGIRCPFCEYDTVVATGGMETDGKTSTQLVKCAHCKKEWKDIYELIGTTEA
jgi:transposase-like protein